MFKAKNLSIFFTAFLAGFILVQVCAKLNTSSPKVKKTEVVESYLTCSSNEDFSVVFHESKDVDEDKQPNFQTKLLEAGAFHSEDLKETTAKSGETWLGLFKQGNKFSLLPTKIKIKKILQPDLVDKEVFISRQEESVFLLKGTKFLKNSKVKTVFYGEKNLLEETGLNFEFNGKTYSLKVEGKDAAGFLGKGSNLKLFSAGKTQILRELKNGGNDAFWYLHWVGDLDNDGKLDFYFNLTDHYNITDKRLFLSSKAEEGELIKEIARLVTVGC